MYKNLGYAATGFVPIAPVIFFGWRVYVEVSEMTGLWWLSIPAAVLTAAGLEIVGILAGHNALGWWKQGDNGRAFLASMLLITYVVIGSVELWGTIGVIVFWIAPLVYMLVALEELLGEVAIGNRRDEEVRRRVKEKELALELERKAKAQELELEQKAKDRELARQLKLQKQQDRKRTVAVSNVDTSKTDWRKLTDTEKLRLLDLSREEIEEMYGVTRKTAGRWLKGAEKLSQTVQGNGHVK